MIQYIKLEKIQPGMELARTVYDENARILLKKGRILSELSINALKTKGYKGIYVITNGKTDIPFPEPLISDEDQLKIISVLKRMYENKRIWDNPLDAEYRNDIRLLEEELPILIETLKQAKSKEMLLFEVCDGRNSNNWMFYHMLNVCLLAIGIALCIDMDERDINNVALSALLHDMGKSAYADALVNKSNLSDAERGQLRGHAEKIFRVLQGYNYPIEVTYAIWQHHEKLNNMGYPNQLSENKIIPPARIIAIANAYDNLVNPNPTNNFTPLYESDALETLYVSREYDVNCMSALSKIVSPYPVGNVVMLSNNRTGIVVRNRMGFPLRPVLLIGGEICDLANDRKWMDTTILHLVKENKII